MALEIISPRQRKNYERFGLSFDYGSGGGWCFDCDEDGQLLEVGPFAKMGMTIAINDFLDGKASMAILTFKSQYTEPAIGKCVCGAEVVLYDDYGHGIDCDGCGRIYSSLGSELRPRSQWEDYYDEDSTQPYNVEFGYAESDY